MLLDLSRIGKAKLEKIDAGIFGASFGSPKSPDLAPYCT
jgi:hypothetical protein